LNFLYFKLYASDRPNLFYPAWRQQGIAAIFVVMMEAKRLTSQKLACIKLNQDLERFFRVTSAPILGVWLEGFLSGKPKTKNDESPEFHLL
jgi:hypothetical protein